MQKNQEDLDYDMGIKEFLKDHDDSGDEEEQQEEDDQH